MSDFEVPPQPDNTAETLPEAAETGAEGSLFDSIEIAEGYFFDEATREQFPYLDREAIGFEGPDKLHCQPHIIMQCAGIKEMFGKPDKISNVQENDPQTIPPSFTFEFDGEEHTICCVPIITERTAEPEAPSERAA